MTEQKNRIEDLGYELSGINSKKMDKEVRKSLELLDHYEREREVWATKFKEAEEFRNGAQWTKQEVEILESRGQNPIVVNRIHPAIETAKALLTANKPQFRATGREDSDRETAGVFSDLFQWIWDNSAGNIELKKTIDDYYTGGMGIMMAYQDPHADLGKGEVMLKNIYPLDVYWDPHAREPFFQDSGHVITSKLMTDEDGLKAYPDFKDIILNAETKKHDRYPSTKQANTESQIFLGSHVLDDSHHITREYIERYTRIRIPFYHIYDPQTKYEAFLDDKEYGVYRQEPAVIVSTQQGSQSFTSESEVQRYITLSEQTGGVFHMMQDPSGQIVPMPGEEHEGAVPGSTTTIEIVTKGDLVDSESIAVNTIMQNRIRVVVSVGTSLMYKRVLPIEDYPFVPLVNIHNRNPYPESDVRIYRPIQEYINKIRSLIIAHASTSTNVKLLIPRGSVDRKQIEKEWGRAGTAVIEFDGELGQPIVAGPVPLPNELYANEQRAKDDLEYGFGIFELMAGGGKNAPSTYRGTVAIDEYGQRRIKSRQDDIEFMLNQLAKVCVPLMQQLYTNEKIVRIVQPSGIVKESIINQYMGYNQGTIEKVKDIAVGRYDIIVVTGSTLPSNRWGQFEYYKEMLQMGAIDQIEFLKKTEVVDVEGVLERSGQIKQLQQQLEQAMAEVKKLRGDLQTSEREGVTARKRLEVEKFKTDLNEYSTSAKKATELFDARLGDQVRNFSLETGQKDSTENKNE
ncbi:MAG: hypothetical protein QF371_00565 [Flavobacteriales bacterium]|jgi:hypothetical protein|nr:hypothetical protein [Flavobacteriales bacterium]